ncbi:glycoside hydrolase superfamily [Aspergillus heterothallicus]
MNIQSLISQLTVDEKISLLAGADFWTTRPIPRLGIPALKVSDGPNGARGANFKGGMTSACFPASVSLAATFDRDLAGRIGKALAEETVTKGANVLLGPTLATQYVRGLQEQGIGATIKHYACNEQETRRFTIDARVSERALREIYLKPFEIAVKNAHAWVVMASFTIVNGDHSDSNKYLLDILRGWGFDGLVMSDWGGVNSVAPSLNAGLDLEMPGPPHKYSNEKIRTALSKGKVTEETLDRRVEAVLRLLERTGKFAKPEIPVQRVACCSRMRMESCQSRKKGQDYGTAEGSEVVQVYVGPEMPSTSVERPIKELAGFAKVRLQPDETKQVTIQVNKDAVSYWSEDSNAWAVEPMKYRIYVGSSSVDISCMLDFTVEKGFLYSS